MQLSIIPIILEPDVSAMSWPGSIVVYLDSGFFQMRINYARTNNCA